MIPFVLSLYVHTPTQVAGHHLRSPAFDRDQTLLTQSKDLYRYIFVLIYNLFFSFFYSGDGVSFKNRIKSAVHQKLPGPFVCVLCPQDLPLLGCWLQWTTSPVKWGFTFCFFLAAVAVWDFCLVWIVIMVCVTFHNGRYWLSSSTLRWNYLDIFSMCCHQRGFFVCFNDCINLSS